MSTKLFKFFIVLLAILIVLMLLPLGETKPDQNVDLEAYLDYITKSRYQRNPVGILAMLASPLAALGALISGITMLVKGRNR